MQPTYVAIYMLILVDCTFRNLIRKTRTSQLESIDKSFANMVFLGKTDRNFEFSQIKQKISFVECSAKKLQFQGLSDWLESL